jgi:hypothetical protein
MQHVFAPGVPEHVDSVFLLLLLPASETERSFLIYNILLFPFFFFYRNNAKSLITYYYDTASIFLIFFLWRRSADM